jgi:hypothetical protein
MRVACSTGPVRGDQAAEGVGQLAQSGAGRGGGLEHSQAAGLELGSSEVGDRLAVGHIDLVQHDQPRPVRQ